MKSMKKLVLAGLILLASVMVLVGCKMEAEPEGPHAHTGGTATCTTKAKCSECGADYGEFTPENHASEGFIYTKHDENTHIKKRVCCDEHVIENCSYSEELCICEKKVDVNESKTTDFHNAWDDGWTAEVDLW